MCRGKTKGANHGMVGNDMMAEMEFIDFSNPGKLPIVLRTTVHGLRLVETKRSCWLTKWLMLSLSIYIYIFLFL